MPLPDALFYVSDLEIFLLPVKQTALTKRKPLAANL